MSIVDTLVVDRTLADTAHWRALREKGWLGMSAAEQAEWASGMKGAYNAIDLNRVGEAINYIASLLRGCGYQCAVSPKTDWAQADIPSAVQMAAYLSDLTAVRAVLPVRTETPDVPASMSGLTVQEANDIEKILQDVDALITKMAAAWFYAGDLYGGEV